MAGIVAAQPRPDSGLIGIAPEATILPIKVDLTQGILKPADVASAISAAVSAGARVVMIPGAVDLSDQVARTAIDDAVGQDVVVVVAGDTTGRATAHEPGVLRVGAIGADDRLVAQYAPGGIDVLAPGDGVVSLSASGTGEIEGSGTDFAVPFVAGLVALVRAAAPELSAVAVTQHIETRANQGRSTPDPVNGFGVINPAAAVTSDYQVPVRETPQAGDSLGRRRLMTTAILVACVFTVVAIVFKPLRRPRGRHAGENFNTTDEPNDI
jgi:subtilisin family serine protease